MIFAFYTTLDRYIDGTDCCGCAPQGFDYWVSPGGYVNSCMKSSNEETSGGLPPADSYDVPPLGEMAGKEACEGRGLGYDECLAVGCCQWDKNGPSGPSLTWCQAQARSLGVEMNTKTTESGVPAG